MIDRPIEIEEPNLSRAWGRAFLRARERPSASRLGPLVVSVTGFEDGEALEDARIRSALDAALERANALERRRSGRSCKQVFNIEECASTIFPLWRWYRESGVSATQLFERYHRMLPRLRARHPANRRGTYFGRMIEYTGAVNTPHGTETRTVNQLGEIIRWWKRDRTRNRSTRHSALQVACFDPSKDHTGSALSGFPCLQQVSFARDTQSDELAVTGYYPTQYIFRRAYGNYLGLCRLGQFMANEMRLRLCRMTCFVNFPLRNDAASRELHGLAVVIRKVLAEQSSPV